MLHAAPPRSLRTPVAITVTLALLIGLSPALTAPAEAARTRTALELRAEARFAALHEQARRNPAAVGITNHPAARATVVAADARAVARAWSDTMQRSGTFNHNPSFARQLCCKGVVAENIARRGPGIAMTEAGVDASVDVLWKRWVDSPGHRRNLMDPRWHDYGVGVSFSGGRMYATVNFRQRNGTPTAPPPADSRVGGTRPVAAVPPPVRDDTSNPKVRRVHGSNRMDTAARVARAAFDRADTVLLARADAYPDALAASALAGSKRAPVLLVGRNLPVDPAVHAALTALRPKQLIVLGGPGVVSDAVLADVRARTGAATRRIAGPDRWATAATAAREVHPAGAAVPRVFLVEGANADANRGWPDALAASGVAARTRAPVLLTLRDELPGPTAAALQALRPAEVVVVGGPSVVSDATVRRVNQLIPSARTVRWAGSDRFATSVTVNERSGLASQAVVVVNGLGYADALAAGAAAAQLGGTLLLTDGRNDAGASTVYTHIAARHRGKQALVVGGPSAITPQVHNRVVRAIGGNAR